VTVERFADGEVSPYLVDVIEVGDAVEVRGPVGGWLVWRPDADPQPVQLIAGGSGIAPLMSMLRTRQASGSTVPFRLLYGVTDPDRAYYGEELAAIVAAGGVTVDLRYSRRVPEGSALQARRLGRDDLAELVLPPAEDPSIFVCGPTGFVEAVSDALLALGYQEHRIRTERFGPTG
jgi:ferredoxin-NADP reductase